MKRLGGIVTEGGEAVRRGLRALAVVSVTVTLVSHAAGQDEPQEEAPAGEAPPATSTSAGEAGAVDCSATPECRLLGLCTAQAGSCVARGDADCQRALSCEEAGRCTAYGGKCVVASDADCTRSTDCEAEGRCAFREGKCVEDSSCTSQEACRLEGRCTRRGPKCVARSDADCAESAGCSREGRCLARNGGCVAASSKDCERSTGCQQSGRCQAASGRCVALSLGDCAYCWACRDDGLCQPLEGECRRSLRCGDTELCREQGRCTWRATTCVAMSAVHCQQSEECDDDGACVVNRQTRRCEDAWERNSTGLMVGGIVATSVGSLAAVVALAFGFLPIAPREPDETRDILAGTIIGLGAAVAIAGIPMIVVGKRRVPRQDVVSWAAELSLGPTAAVLHVTW
ncbi:MAG: hypothetical protein JRI68_10665 [Deltaproteobacteria bacterium]|nr:hypothetical protein [Deltaproteobacteria bacterium]